MEWERESDGHVQNLSQLYPVHVTLGVVGVIHLKTLFSSLGHRYASHQFTHVWNTEQFCWLMLFLLKVFTCRNFIIYVFCCAIIYLGYITLCHVEHLNYELCTESNLRWYVLLSISYLYSVILLCIATLSSQQKSFTYDLPIICLGLA